MGRFVSYLGLEQIIDFNIWLWARKVIRSFKKWAPGHTQSVLICYIFATTLISVIQR